MIGVLFSIDTQDWTLPGVTAIVRSALRARDGQIIALHDAGGDREQTVQALPLIVKGLRAQGLEVGHARRAVPQVGDVAPPRRLTASGA